MAFYGKEFTCYKDENFDAFLRNSGVPEDKIALMTQHKPSCKVTQSGDSYTLTSTSPSGPKVTNFKSGVEFEDVIGEQKTPMKTTYTVDGNTITQVIKTDQGQGVFKREFNGNELVVTITSDKFDGVAKRYYKA